MMQFQPLVLKAPPHASPLITVSNDRTCKTPPVLTAECSSLQDLNLARTGVSDHGLSLLRFLPLQRLCIAGCSVGDPALRYVGWECSQSSAKPVLQGKKRSQQAAGEAAVSQRQAHSPSGWRELKWFDASGTQVAATVHAREAPLLV